MPIYQKETVQTYIEKLDLYYKELRTALEGTNPDPANAELYSQHPKIFQDDFTQVDLLKIETAIQHFKVEVDCLKQLKRKELQLQRLTRR